jgi:GNAT superfamily N-acetyltransferase
VRITPLSVETLPAWAALFEESGSACFCRYWHFAGTKNEWLARCFEDPGANRDEHAEAVRAGALEARGLLALEGEVAIGWMKLAPRAVLVKLRRQGAYRALDLGSDEGIWSIGCLLVHPRQRRKGVARALLGAAASQVLDWGGSAVEGYPHRVSHALHDEEAWMGPESVFLALGYQPVHDVAPYPVLRKAL